MDGEISEVNRGLFVKLTWPHWPFPSTQIVQLSNYMAATAFMAADGGQIDCFYSLRISTLAFKMLVVTLNRYHTLGSSLR